eukprot:CAMPEP_0175155306 /NCGR_PEP_ID=MMETSP0087-20121206/20894_1 /TAXON_ID=136419 /ORGANISM="Unknown Unknown, Strain D1" /LENGTH=72 /DNA_ID=CAMNT_0016442431 /DNA_START=429 /DNA_END=645 /DNA_ORIENTATION=-
MSWLQERKWEGPWGELGSDCAITDPLQQAGNTLTPTPEHADAAAEAEAAGEEEKKVRLKILIKTKMMKMMKM